MAELSKEELQQWLDDGDWEDVKQKVTARRLVLLPALVDCHVHFRVPGAEQKEDWVTGSEAAVFGGICAVIDMPNNTPAMVDAATYKQKKSLVHSQKKYGLHAFFNLGASGTVVPDNGIADDVVGLKIYVGSSTGDLLVDSENELRRIYEQWDKVIVVHAEDDVMISENAEKLADYSGSDKHSRVRDRAVAVSAVKMVLELVREFNKPTVIAHISTKEEVDLIREAKNDGLPVFAEVTPHHLFLNELHYEQWGDYVKVNPPLRTAEDNEALWAGLRDGTIDVISTDHAPHLPAEKESGYETAPAGIPEIDTVLSLMLNAVNEGKIGLDRLIDAMHTKPIAIFNLPSLGQCGTVVDMAKKQTVSKERLKTKCGWTPYEGMELQGWPLFTIIDNKAV
ncbi:MAG: dihydroorotase [Candidatus Kerfeldbacteria bacterium]